MPAKRVPARTMPDKWDDSADVVVVGCGYAGAVAAIEAHDAGASVRLFRVIEDNIRQRSIRLLLSTPALRLITDDTGEIRGLTADHNGKTIRIRARRAVVLACGGFEANPEMQRQHWQEKPVLNAAYMGNTGDGIVMAQDV